MTRRGRNEGSIYQRKDGRWAATINLGYEGGRRVRKSFYGRTRREVQDALTRALRDVQLGLPVARDERQTVAVFLERWLRDSAAPSTRPRTLQGYSVIVGRHLLPSLGRVPLMKLSPEQVQAMLNRLTAAGASPQTVRNVHAVLRRALNQAVRWGIVPRNVAALVDVPRQVRYEAAIIGPEEARKILAAVSGDRHEALVILTLATGLRQGEALALRWTDIDLDAGSLTVRRTLQRAAGSRRRVRGAQDVALAAHGCYPAVRRRRPARPSQAAGGGAAMGRLALARGGPRVHVEHRNAAHGR